MTVPAAPVEERPRDTRGYWTLALVVSLILFAVWQGPQAWKYLRIQRFAHLAQSNFEKNQYDQAAFYAGRAWQLDSHSDPALEILAHISRLHQKSDAIRWMGLWMENRPDDLQRQIEFAQMVLLSGQIEPAEKILNALSPRSPAETQQKAELQAAVALARKQTATAEKIYRNLLVTYPEEPSPAFNLANILLTSSDPARQAAGRQLLEDLWKKQKMTLEVSRTFAQLAIRQKQPSLTAPWLQVLQTAPDANLNDQLLAGWILLQSGTPLPAVWLQRLATLCRDPNDAYNSMLWLRRQGQEKVVEKWAETLPPYLRQAPVVRIGLAETWAENGQWDSISTKLEKENWGASDHFRLVFLQEAYLRHAPDHRQTLVRKTHWDLMIRSLVKAPGDIFPLLSLARHWQWPTAEINQLLEELTQKMPPVKTTVLALLREAEARRNTLALYHFGRKFLSFDPQNLAARNNVAFYGLLLNKDPNDNLTRAEKLFQENPGNVNVRSTWAFALYQQNRAAEALNLFQGLSPENLRQPGVALYYALALQATGKKEEARPYFDQALTSPKLLPEERALASQARSAF
jgi:predicted Zn-dependent protease